MTAFQHKKPWLAPFWESEKLASNKSYNNLILTFSPYLFFFIIGELRCEYLFVFCFFFIRGIWDLHAVYGSTLYGAKINHSFYLLTAMQLHLFVMIVYSFGYQVIFPDFFFYFHVRIVFEKENGPKISRRPPTARCLQSQRDVHMMMKRLLVTGLSGDHVHSLQTIPLGPLNPCVIGQHDCTTPDSVNKLHTGYQKMNSLYQDLKLQSGVW